MNDMTERVAAVRTAMEMMGKEISPETAERVLMASIRKKKALIAIHGLSAAALALAAGGLAGNLAGIGTFRGVGLAALAQLYVFLSRTLNATYQVRSDSITSDLMTDALAASREARKPGVKPSDLYPPRS